ncbi:phosphoribosylformylglycinamidine synthase subunit PurL [Candidatus Viridilinea mediisalina]|uniref:Phosphoribosylformylglycinamidine synthase subunit PurL n=1 Tax=Candidatus Viridilinea mediisalina TaxID=2024553 RepID=A0A2A6RJ33_9CHLR|nr:phosphoribosylformylglycinamidine synthase subunit PurL [Candidatus Viridilinea mediisalina]PDW02868.1 phosphoribosylformylglycinamidine synthase subunit PurL [Candidatus Viridilinea mediisalina]
MAQFFVTVASREATHPETIQTIYVLEGLALRLADVARLATELLHDPVTETVTWRALTLDELMVEPLPAAAHMLEVAYRPGVTDNAGESVLEGARRLGIAVLDQARMVRRYLLTSGVDPAARAAELTIDLVQTSLIAVPGIDHRSRLRFYQDLISPPAHVQPRVVRVALREADDAELLRISRDGILALDLAEMHAVRDHFVALGRDPSDGELETLAQTWSEHCSHKSFKAKVRYRRATPDQRAAALDPQLYPAFHLLEQDEVELNSLIKTFLMAATERIVAPESAAAHFTLAHGSLRLPEHAWVRSAFVDNAGIIAFGPAHEVSFKVETHNHPSALEPFGGANTGVGGVIRDVLGVSAEPIANTDVLCFGMPDTPAEALQPGVLHPQRVALGVVAGVRDYGNKLGIPTVNGAVLFDSGYSANPLVYAGTVGLAPRDAHPRNVAPGDVIVLLGGHTGRDGIHGATFSSIELTHDTAATVGSAVQIGDPITEKKLLDVLLQARDQRLYSAITDCGAGGLSSAVGEMGAGCGAHVTLERVPLKYAGLQPWEIWLSEAQERMVLAVPPTNLNAFLALCEAEDVEATAIGTFTADGRLRVNYKELEVVDLAMEFLHDGLPQRVLEALWQSPERQPIHAAEGAALPASANLLLQLLAHPNISSKERVVRTYDHEVRGATILKPLVGVALDGPGDAAVLQPVATMQRGLALGCGINPRYGRIDPYWMALAAVDEALRNVVAVGGDPGRTAILDNFCWGDPRQPDRMAGLVRAAAGCYDAAVAFGTPFISGKDSLNNEYRDAAGQRVAIPPTLLISALAEVPDVRRCVSMDLKQAGNRIYLVGATRAELGGSHLDAILGRDGLAGQVPQVDLVAARATFAALHGAITQGLVAACHDLSEGGLAVAAAEMVLAGHLGLDLELDALGGELDVTTRLFSETPSRFLVEVRPGDAAAFESVLAGVALVELGAVQHEALLRLRADGQIVAEVELDALRQAWQAGLSWM